MCTILYVYVWAVHEVNRAVIRYMCITCLCVHLLIESASRVLCSIVCMTMYSIRTRPSKMIVLLKVRVFNKYQHL